MISSLALINATINQLESKVLLIAIFLPEIISCLQTFNTVASKEIVGDTCVTSLIVFSTTINQLESKASLITTYLFLFTNL